MAMSKRVVLGAIGVIGASGVVQADKEAATCADPNTSFTFEYGPASAAGIQPGGQIGVTISQLGAPYDTYGSGNGRTIYRWGHGITTQNPDGTGSIQRDELLVTADASGVITSVSYKAKCSVCGNYAMVIDACP